VFIIFVIAKIEFSLDGRLRYYSSSHFQKNEKQTEKNVHGTRKTKVTHTKLTTTKASPHSIRLHKLTTNRAPPEPISSSTSMSTLSVAPNKTKTTMKSSIISCKHRIIITVFVLLSLTNLAEGKLRLVPRGKKTKKQQLRKNKTTQTGKNIKPNKAQVKKTKKKQQQVLLKPKVQKEALNLQLQATLGTNEKGEKVLLLSEESAAAVSNAMQSTSTDTSTQVGKKKQQEAEPVKLAAVEEAEAAVEEEEEPEEQQVLFYDPAELKTAAGDIPLPKRVFDADGNEVDMAGKEAILVRPSKDDAKHPPPPPSLEKDQEVIEVRPFISI